MKLGTLVLALLVTLQFGAFAQADGWGTIKGKFVVDGKIAPAKAIPVPIFGAPVGAVPNQKLVIGPNGELPNVALWLAVPKGDAYPEPHPSYAASANDVVELTCRGFILHPYLAFTRTSQTVRFKNLDPAAEELAINAFFNPAFRPQLAANGGQEDKRFELEERTPCVINSRIHPWVESYLIVRESPYVAISNEKGEFEIANVPAGTWTFQFWHTACGYVNEFKLLGQYQNERKGLHQIEVVADQVTDLGVIQIPSRRLDN
ncbi:hypothetical protein LOC68_13560 [Blastopirellula sp. JC732]|uniref:Rhamnogalacturonan lyase domain-containing protein n=1 Tax=Blastopirellula sediminis TaxID=2894196 RepID=A0A9X1MM99_9BACT|nr:hypothetical protein [Blastopirellula sediminis]MCC9607286.1 hypothetical protein [Blastopirellula sediminis]MCC9629421.1 hypothetical protein [Blastopirellula sediminis]